MDDGIGNAEKMLGWTGLVVLDVDEQPGELVVTADPALIERAEAIQDRDAATTAKRHHDEVIAIGAEIRRTEAAIERYFRAPEAGTVSDEMFGLRVRELGARRAPSGHGAWSWPGTRTAPPRRSTS